MLEFCLNSVYHINKSQKALETFVKIQKLKILNTICGVYTSYLYVTDLAQKQTYSSFKLFTTEN